MKKLKFLGIACLTFLVVYGSITGVFADTYKAFTRGAKGERLRFFRFYQIERHVGFGQALLWCGGHLNFNAKYYAKIKDLDEKVVNLKHLNYSSLSAKNAADEIKKAVKKNVISWQELDLKGELNEEKLDEYVRLAREKEAKQDLEIIKQGLCRGYVAEAKAQKIKTAVNDLATSWDVLGVKPNELRVFVAKAMLKDIQDAYNKIVSPYSSSYEAEQSLITINKAISQGYTDWSYMEVDEAALKQIIDQKKQEEKKRQTQKALG